MTTIAVRDGIMASDTAVTGFNTNLGEIKKLYRIGDSIFGAAGAITDCISFLDAHRTGTINDLELDNADIFSALELTKDGEVYTWTGSVMRLPIERDYHAVGSGMEFALGAMSAGADADEAVICASELDVNTRQPIQVMTW